MIIYTYSFFSHKMNVISTHILKNDVGVERNMDEIIIERDNCVLCDNCKLQDIQTVKMPLYIVNNPDNTSWDMKYGYCEQCYSVQLKTLLDPNILYDKNYIQPLSTSYSWVQHNMSFINFIIKSIPINQPLIEIGSSSFVLGKHLLEYYKDFTVFDYSIEQANQQEGVTYIEGNCENYHFPKDSTIIMSHVFEHLYEPKKFIENCKKNSVENILISIPNMNDLTVFNVFNHHTFLYNDDDIEYIFNLYNYKLTDKVFFNAKDSSFPCLFFHFTLDVSDEPKIVRPIIENRHLYTIQMMNSFYVPEKTFIATAGFMSLTIFGFINHKNIVGVIDQNKLLHNKHFGCTNLTIQPYEYLKGFSSEYSILVHGYRTPDIINCIRKINTDIQIIIFPEKSMNI